MIHKTLRLLLLMAFFCLQAAAHDGPALRRPISPSQPAWIIHIDVWNTADPQKIIDLIPKDIRPYVIFNIATSSSNSVSPNGPAVYDAWLKVCAANRVWAMIQCSSGAHNRMPDNAGTAAYERYFKQYPNFLGFNFAEQFWDFGTEGCPTFLERLQLFADLLPVCHKYGGYLAVSFTQAYYSANMMPMAYMKRNSQWRNFMRTDNVHFLCFEKYTMSSAFYDIESNCLGAWLGGYAGQYGIRFDRCGWHEAADCPFQPQTGGMQTLEHVLLTGETMIDGPELIWQDDFKETGTTVNAQGFTQRNWALYPQMTNVTMDIMRMILDGTVRIPTRREVIDRTKIAVLNDIPVTTTDDPDHKPYLTPGSLFNGLYRPDVDHKGMVWPNDWLENHWWLKQTGRYPTIPNLGYRIDEDAQRLQVVRRSVYDSRWGNVAKKVEELNQLFPEEYHGDIYAAHHENAWMTYNPLQYSESVKDTTSNGRSWVKRIQKLATRYTYGFIPLQYNTADSLGISYAPYSMGLIKEYTDSIAFYLNNFRIDSKYNEFQNATDTLRIFGTEAEPTLVWSDRANHRASQVTAQWADGVYTLVVSHNGPVELHVACRGNATGRKSQYTEAVIEQPALAPEYNDTLEVDCENADYRNIARIVKNGYGQGHDGYLGLGYAELGTKTGAMLNDTVIAPRAGQYKLIVRFWPTVATGDKVYVFVNGSRNLYLLKGTPGQWNTYEMDVELRQGKNRVALTRTSSTANMMLDCFQFVPTGPSTGIQGIVERTGSPALLRREYFDLSGRRVTDKTVHAVGIVKSYYSDGTVESRKLMR